MVRYEVGHKMVQVFLSLLGGDIFIGERARVRVWVQMLSSEFNNCPDVCHGHAFLCVRSKRADTAAEKFMEDFPFIQSATVNCAMETPSSVPSEQADAAMTVLPDGPGAEKS